MSAREMLHMLEYQISDAKRCSVDDKMSVETRLVMVAIRLETLDRLVEQVDAALVKEAAQ